MAIYFHDTSALVKRYVQEVGTAWLQALTSPQTSDIHIIARITKPELVAAVSRRERGGNLAAHHAATALQDFDYDFVNQYQIAEITPMLLDRAAVLARTHRLRGYDAVQLVVALEAWSIIPTLTLISADSELNAAATVEGMTVDNPNAHP